MNGVASYDTIIIGGGFYGLRLAQFVHDELGQQNILVLEKEADLMSRASYNNQARVHFGYHYPRSVLTALRSKVNAPIFTKEYEPAVVSDFTKYYGVASQLSKVSAKQFLRFFERIGAKIQQAPSEITAMFNTKLVDQVFEVEELVFNSKILKKMLTTKLAERGIKVMTNEKVITVNKTADGFINVKTDSTTYKSKYVLNTTYSSINNVNARSKLPIIPFKHELAEMALISLPRQLDKTAFTLMCGPFFSIMPFPDKNAYTLSHVRYTPHSEWHDTEEYIRDSHRYLDNVQRISHYPQMIADVKRYMPEIGNKIQYLGESLWEIKTVLPQSEDDDSRPILYKAHHGELKNYICIMGGKIDNIYDVFRELKATYGTTT